jgi:S-formylglutathione hydrolase
MAFTVFTPAVKEEEDGGKPAGLLLYPPPPPPQQQQQGPPPPPQPQPKGAQGPPGCAAAAAAPPFPVVYYLSGLTCTDENAAQKSGAQRAAARLGLALVFPDTSPRPSGEGPGAASFPAEAAASGWDFGFGAGFYLDATKEGWESWQMESYVMQELPAALARLPGGGGGGGGGQLDRSRAGIMGHSMGGHGALTLALRHPAAFRSVSALAPVCSPTRAPWGEKAFRGYFGDAEWLTSGREHDAAELVRLFPWGKGGPEPPAPLIDTGGADSFLEKQLMPGELARAVEETPGCAWATKAGGGEEGGGGGGGGGGSRLVSRLQPGYDHSYFFVATFIEEHLEHHARALLADA